MHVMPKCYSVGATGLKRHSYAELIVIHMKTTSAALLP